ncbi:MAG: NAD-dependent epimerase/dehydratase family protein [Xanthobacteraceae bacterium]
MRIFVAGATGAIGRPLVSALITAGHSVVGLTRTAAKAETIRRMGATRRRRRSRRGGHSRGRPVREARCHHS